MFSLFYFHVHPIKLIPSFSSAEPETTSVWFFLIHDWLFAQRSSLKKFFMLQFAFNMRES
jgi:hypothetical protein